MIDDPLQDELLCIHSPPFLQSLQILEYPPKNTIVASNGLPQVFCNMVRLPTCHPYHVVGISEMLDSETSMTVDIYLWYTTVLH